MNRCTKRLFTLLLSLFTAGIAMRSSASAAPYIFNVENRSPFGVLNLSQLIIKPDVDSPETMDMSGYILSIKTKDGEIHVHQICDENGYHCKEIESLGDGSTTPTGITISGSTNNFCVKVNDTTLNCSNDTLSGIVTNIVTGLLPTEITINSGVVGSYCTYVDENTIQCIANGGEGTQILSGTDDLLCTKSGDNLVCLTPILTGDGEGISVGATINGGYCKYTCVNEGELSEDERTQLFGQAQGKTEGDLKCIITCTDTGSTSEGLWIVAPFSPLTNPFITPSKTNNIMLHQDLYHSGSFEFYSYQGMSFSQAASHFTFDAKGIRIGDTAASIATGAGLSVAGIIAAGNNYTDNYIYMYATGNNSDLERHYEIMGNEQLAIGTKAGAFLYFTQRTGYYNSNLEYGGSVATNYYNPGSCIAKSNEGNSNYTLAGSNSNGGLEGVDEGSNDDGDGNGEYTCTPSQGHERNSIPKPSNIGVQDAYESLMVGVNTNAPNATLDVNGSIRIGSNCVPFSTKCNRDKVGTIMYVENDTEGYLIMCIKQGSIYTRYDIINGTSRDDLYFGSLGNGDRKCELPKPTPGTYPSFTGQASMYEPLEY